LILLAKSKISRPILHFHIKDPRERCFRVESGAGR
jgi:hypothetical protein